MPHAPSLKSLARSLGLARTTVSDALRGKGRVGAATIRRVQRAAKLAGYKPNPLVAAVLGSINRSQGARFRGSIAVVDLHETSHWPHGPFSRELVAGAKVRAAEMGFSIDEFVVGSEVLPWHRLDSILQSRGIHGVVVLPAWFQPDLSALNWSRYAGIYADYVTTGPELHSICADHYGSMRSLLTLLAARGYRRPGLVLSRGRDERVQGRQSAAFISFQTEQGRSRFVPPLIVPEQTLETAFVSWFRRHRPDVVLSHARESLDWLKACAGSEPPGFVLLNILHGSAAFAGLDLQPRVIGARAIELVVGQVLRNEFGIPQWPSRTAVQARWVEGPTVRPSEK